MTDQTTPTPDEPASTVPVERLVVRQTVVFRGGPYDGKMAVMQFPKGFDVGMDVVVNGSPYIVRDGPIAASVEREQKEFENCAVVLVYA